jgi:hypothetical protein
MKRTEYTQPWLDALRSGEYKQGKTSLFSNGAYCCIGVAAHLIGALDPENRNQGYGEVREKLCMSSGEMWALIHRNDGVEGREPMLFPEIADKIEEMLEPVE